MTEETGGHQADWRKMIMDGLAQQHIEFTELRKHVDDRFDKLTDQVRDAATKAEAAKGTAVGSAKDVRIWVLASVASVLGSIMTAIIIWHLTHGVVK